jgi:hypothetical protein
MKVAKQAILAKLYIVAIILHSVEISLNTKVAKKRILAFRKNQIIV